jgi:4-hydroxy-tetrahydrodipicolinate synthase
MTTNLAITGVYCAAVTPVAADLSPNLEAFARHCRWLVDEGCDGVAVLGTTGEANSFSLAERRRLLEAAADAVTPGRLLPGTSASNIPEAIELTRHAVETGVRGVVMLPPFYYKGVHDDGLFDFYARVIEGVGDPRLRVLLYHIPQVSAVPISLDLIGRLRDAFPEVVVGIKDSAGAYDNMQAIIDRFPDFAVLVGADPLLGRLMRAGGAGAITSTSNLVPGDLATVYRWARDPSHAAEVERAEERIVAYRTLATSYAQIPTVKAMLAILTGDDGWNRPRPPMVPLDAAELAEIRAKLAALPAAA